MSARANAAVAVAFLVLAYATGRVRAEEGKGRPLTQDEIKAGQFTLQTKRLAAMLMVPDKPTSAYAGPRYESGGVVMQVTLDGKHTFLGKEGRGERLGGFGLIEEMGISKAVGYEEAKEGEAFLKLGIGLVARGKRPEYSFYEALPVAERFGWEVSVSQRAATYIQVGKPFKGHAYRYEKRIELDEKGPALRIEHTLANTGEKAIETDQYCHNYFRFDDAPPGPDYLVEMGFPLEPILPLKPPMVVEGKTATFSEILKGAAYCRFKGQPPTAKSHRFRIHHKANGLEVTVGGDFPVSYYAYYADPQAASPEAFCAISVKPGETFRWTRTYGFAAR